MEDKKKYEIFSGKTLENLFQDIYNNSSNIKNVILSLINNTKDLVKTSNDATLLVPLIAEYLEIGVKNDEHLIKLADTIQRLIKTNNNDNSELLSDDEKQKLLEIYSSNKEDKTEIDNIKSKVIKFKEEAGIN